MALDQKEWENAKEAIPRSTIDLVRDFLRSTPEKSYRLEEIINQTGLVNFSNAAGEVKPFKVEGSGTPEDFASMLYAMLVVEILIELGDAEKRYVEENSDVAPGGSRGIAFYRYSHTSRT